jgi:hypothetical protein
METRTLAKVNNVAIQVVETNKEKLVPIKPICEALGIDRKAQQDKIEEDEFLSSVRVLSPLTGTDGKQYEMTCLPYEFIFGWLFTINPKNVKEDAREAVAKYRIECYRALYRHFTSQSDFLLDKQKFLELRIEEYQAIQSEFKTAKDRLAKAKVELNRAKEFTYEEWEANSRQIPIDFPEHPEE